MNLIVIYGPPAVGKLTVAKAVVQKNYYKLFHNHLAVDLVESVFPFGTKQFSDLNARIKLIMIEEAAKNNVDLVFTLVYGVETLAGTREDDFVKDIIKAAENHQGSVYFIKLTCSKNEQISRLSDESRKRYKKMTDPVVLAEVEKAVKLDEKIAFVESLIIDNTSLSPEEVADKVIDHIKRKAK